MIKYIIDWATSLHVRTIQAECQLRSILKVQAKYENIKGLVHILQNLTKTNIRLRQSITNEILTTFNL